VRANTTDSLPNLDTTTAILVDDYFFDFIQRRIFLKDLSITLNGDFLINGRWLKEADYRFLNAFSNNYKSDSLPCP
jgi:hypothetical protein